MRTQVLGATCGAEVYVIIGQSPRRPFSPGVPAGVDETVQAQISHHVDEQLQRAQALLSQGLVELQQAVTAAEQARERWLTTGRITSTAAGADPCAAAAVDREVLALSLQVDRPCQQAWQATHDHPSDLQAREQLAHQQTRVAAVRSWLHQHGYDAHALAEPGLDWS